MTSKNSWARTLWWRDWPLLALTLAVLAAGLAFAPKLPDRLPTHWNLQGEVDGWSSKWMVLVGAPATTAFLYVLMAVAPQVDPGRSGYPRFLGLYRLTRAGLMGVVALAWGLSVGHGLGWQMAVDRWLLAAVGLLLAALGNQLGRVPPTYLYGVRTPWTLADGTVWRRTHRLAGPVWVLGGLAMAVSGLLLPTPWKAWIFFLALAAMILVPTVYSYLAYRRRLAEGIPPRP